MPRSSALQRLLEDVGSQGRSRQSQNMGPGLSDLVYHPGEGDGPTMRNLPITPSTPEYDVEPLEGRGQSDYDLGFADGQMALDEALAQMEGGDSEGQGGIRLLSTGAGGSPSSRAGDGVDSGGILDTIGDAAGAVGDAVGGAVDWAGENVELPSASEALLGPDTITVIGPDGETRESEPQLGIVSPGGLSGAARGAAGAAARRGGGLLGRIGSSRAGQAARSVRGGLDDAAAPLNRIGQAVQNHPIRSAVGGTVLGGLGASPFLSGSDSGSGQQGQGQAGPTLADQLGQQSGQTGVAGGGQQEAAMPEGRVGGPPSSRAGTPGSLEAGDDGLSALDGIIRDLEGQSQQVEEDFQNQRERLRDQFSMSETPEEQAQLAFMLEDLEARRDAAQEAIATEYGRAQDAVRGVAAETRQRAETAGQPIEQRYQQGAQAARQGQQEVRQDYADSGVGVGAVDPDTSVESTANMMEQRALSEGDFAEARTDIAASDSEWMADTLAAEEPAQQGALQRTIAMQQGQAQREHAQQVNQRIAQDRRTLAQLESQLMNQQHTRQGSILDRAAQLQMQQDQLEQREREFAAEQGASQGGAGGADEAMSGNFPQNLVGNPEMQTQVMLGLQMEGQTGTMRSLVQGGFIDESVAQAFAGSLSGGSAGGGQ